MIPNIYVYAVNHLILIVGSNIIFLLVFYLVLYRLITKSLNKQMSILTSFKQTFTSYTKEDKEIHQKLIDWFGIEKSNDVYIDYMKQVKKHNIDIINDITIRKMTNFKADIFIDFVKSMLNRKNLDIAYVNKFISDVDLSVNFVKEAMEKQFDKDKIKAFWIFHTANTENYKQNIIKILSEISNNKRAKITSESTRFMIEFIYNFKEYENYLVELKQIKTLAESKHK